MTLSWADYGTQSISLSINKLSNIRYDFRQVKKIFRISGEKKNSHLRNVLYKHNSKLF